MGTVIRTTSGSHTPEREILAQWMMARGYATGHGDTVAALLDDLDWQINEANEQRSSWNLECTKQIGTLMGERDRWREMFKRQVIAAEDVVSVLRDLLLWYDPERASRQMIAQTTGWRDAMPREARS
jgi:hypothetical protein